MLHGIQTPLLATHIRGGFISATLIDNNTLTYRIALNSFVDAGSTVLFGGGMMDFGDGSSPVQFVAGKPDFYKLLDETVAMDIFYANHSFPGPGVYTIGYREFNRNASVANMDNSVNTPFYVETRIMIDPYLGANSSAKIMNYFPFKNNIDQPYIYPLSVIDLDGDSISIEPNPPLQDKDIPVANYFVPANFDGDKILSQLQLHIPSNEIVWANPLEEDEYNYAVKIREWRYSQSEKTWVDVGFTIFDFQMIFIDRSDNPPQVHNFKDTVILNTGSYEEEFTILEDNSDSVRVWISENLPRPNNFKTTLDQEIYHSTPLQGKISILNTENLQRPYPYKIVISMNPKQLNSTSSQISTMLWITDHPGKPNAPVGLKTELAFRNKIIISWQDQSEEEAGFTIERADSFFPDFIRIAALPQNSTEFTDENVIPNRDYYYRIKAIGTEGSSYSEILEVRELDIITGIDDQYTQNEFILYPNPVQEYLIIQYDKNTEWPKRATIVDITGRIQQQIDLNRRPVTDALSIPTDNLTPGLYILQLIRDDFIRVRKFIKN